MFIEIIIMFSEQFSRALIVMAVKAEGRALISIKHQANLSLLPSQSAAGSNYLCLFLCICYEFVPCCQGDKLLLLTFQECINPGDQLMYREGTEQGEYQLQQPWPVYILGTNWSRQRSGNLGTGLNPDNYKWWESTEPKITLLVNNRLFFFFPPSGNVMNASQVGISKQQYPSCCGVNSHFCCWPQKAGVVMGCWLPPLVHRGQWLEQHEKPSEATKCWHVAACPRVERNSLLIGDIAANKL